MLKIGCVWTCSLHGGTCGAGNSHADLLARDALVGCEHRGELTPYCQRTSAVRAKDAVTTGFANGSEAESRSSKVAADIIEHKREMNGSHWIYLCSSYTAVFTAQNKI